MYHASQWKEIGSELGFLQGELKNIEGNQTLQDPKAYLTEMLSKWLQWAPKDRRGSKSHATKESLVTALANANLGQLAEEIKQLQLSQ